MFEVILINTVPLPLFRNMHRYMLNYYLELVESSQKENLLTLIQSYDSHISFQMSLVGSKRVAPARRASPSRDDIIRGADNNVEHTFQQKLQEIKKMRMSAKSDDKEGDKVVPKKVQTVNGLKTFLKRHGDWVEVVSKSGKVYYYNKRTLVNQWKKPEDWLREEERLNNPPLPPQPEPPQQPPQPPQPPPPPQEDEETGKLKLKLMTMKKLHKRLKNPDANLPRAYQKNQKRLDESDSDTEESAKPKMTISNAFENPDDGDKATGQQKLAKLDAEDEIGHLKIPEPVEDDDNKPSESADSAIVQSEHARKFNPRMSGPERAENLAEGCAAQLAFKNISSLPNPGDSSAPSAGSGNPTYFTEYNLPCTLRRCKFPKEQDVLHELKQNKTKRRTFIQPPMMEDLDSKLSHLAQEAQMEQFMAEVKNYNNHDRLMTSRMEGVLVYKIPDDVWER